VVLKEPLRIRSEDLPDCHAIWQRPMTAKLAGRSGAGFRRNRYGLTSRVGLTDRKNFDAGPSIPEYQLRLFMAAGRGDEHGRPYAEIHPVRHPGGRSTINGVTMGNGGEFQFPVMRR
jgi:hypothetical protein